MDLQTQIDELNRKLDTFLSEYYRNNNPTSQIFTKKIYFRGGANFEGESVVVGRNGGTVSFYGKTPVSQASAIVSPSTPSGTYSQGEAQSAVNAINQIATALSNIGITV